VCSLIARVRAGHQDADAPQAGRAHRDHPLQQRPGHRLVTALGRDIDRRMGEESRWSSPDTFPALSATLRIRASVTDEAAAKKGLATLEME